LEWLNITIVNNKKILITGINGLVGQYLLKALDGSGAIVMATGKGPLRVPELMSAGMVYRELDITDGVATNNLVNSFKPDIIIHSAAMTQADQCELNKADCWINNVTATRFLIGAAKELPVFLIYLSTDFVFSGEAGPYMEDDPTGPVNYYGSSKLAAEKAVIESGCPYAIVRTVLVYGQTADGTRSNIISWVKKELENGKKIKVVDDQVRTPTYAGDLASGILRVAFQHAEGIWHISGEENLTPYQMAIAVSNELGLDRSLIEKTDAAAFQQPAQRPLRTGFIITKAKALLGYQPVPFSEGIRKMLKDQV
jgi:dTDP-4-dehydrorhamnose reductase